MLKFLCASLGRYVRQLADAAKVRRFVCADWVAIPTYLVGVWVFDRERGRGKGQEGERNVPP